MFDRTEIDEAIAWRRDLHRHPELGFEEHRTSQMIAGLLTGWGWRVHRGLAGTGIVAQMGQGGLSIGLRADIDALPIAEATGLPYASVNPGKMHACGHDGHTAMLLLAARQIARDGVEGGTVTLIFQPAEENDGGARVMMEEGLFRDFPVDRVFGIHNWPGLAPGRMVARDGRMMAAFAVFEIEISGRGGHAAMPEQSDGVMAAAGAMVGALQEIPARALSPLEPGVVSVTQIHSGSAWNVCPDKAVLRGTARWFDAGAGDVLQQRIHRVAQAVADAQGCTVRVDYQRRYPATINAPAEAGLARDAAREQGLDTADAAPSMASEDFAFMLQAVPGAYLWLGAARDGDNPGLHSPRFDFNDALLPVGAELWVRLVRRCLAA
ncbi:M20 aminoacylase family protein [Paracoccus fistulariae]|uniref:Amidohydrolase n=1 Tax=Paracoccus fistulariae TaxID=658446 RepID=A0ABY7SLN4_9RHOB|nr:M20 aminoacylase family protein [Paracoccus fistulariae]MDB6182605.1 M20 family metallopeptidase [Paracoccus fistulariae]WCR07810.1 amidohydrolase [Paracoccus fistulariae]